MFIIPPLRQDELLESWLVSICQYNDSKIYCSPKIKELDIKNISYLKSEDLLNICTYLRHYNMRDFMDVIHNHTIYPYITPFTDSTKILWKEIKMNYLKYLDNAKDYHRAYFSLANPKVCVECIKEESSTFGGAYIHRTHQIPGNYFCIKHNSKLKIANGFFNHVGNIMGINLTDLQKFDDIYSDKLKLLSTDINSLTYGIMSGFTIDYIKMIIYIIMEEKGYINNMVIKHEFYSEFNKYHNYSYLHQLNNALYTTGEDIFDFNKLLLKPGISSYSPIQMILIIRMLLNGGLREFIHYSKEQSTYEKLYRLKKQLKQKVYIDLNFGSSNVVTVSENLYQHLLENKGEFNNYK